jgi:hypothetical protein
MATTAKDVRTTLPPNFPTPDEFALWSGLEDRQEDLSKAMMVVLKTLRVREPYPHNINSAVVMAHLMAIQFAKSLGMLPKLVEFDIRTMEPITKRIGKMVQQSGNREYALIGMFERTGCHYQLVIDTAVEPGRRTWKSPFRDDLAAGRRVGQFDLTEREVHEQWTTPRLLGYAASMGVSIRVSPWRDDGMVTCELVD